MLAGKSPKSTNFGLSLRTELLAKFILSRSLTLATSPGNVYKPITFLKKDVECPFTAKDPSRGALSGSVFLFLLAILEWLGLITSCVLQRAGEMELGLEPGLGEFNLVFVSALLTACGMEPSLLCGLPSQVSVKWARNCAPHPWRSHSGATSGVGSKSLALPPHWQWRAG